MNLMFINLLLQFQDRVEQSGGAGRRDVGCFKLDLGGLMKIGGEGLAWRLNTMVT